MKKIIFAIDKLNRGGAECQFIELVKGIDKKRFQVWAVVFHEGGVLHPELDKIDHIRTISLNRQGRWHTISFLLRLLTTIYRIKPDIIHSYMGGTNEVCLILGKFFSIKTVWGIRSSDMDFSHYDWFAQFSFKAGQLLSYFADLIIVNSHAGKNHYLSHGYSGKRMEVISNGIDTGRFSPDPKSGEQMRMQWGIEKDTILIGLVGRIVPKKDQETFLKAAALLVKENNNVHFVCVGDGQEPYKSNMIKLGQDLGLGMKILWTGACDKMSDVYNAIDILTSSSAYGEGFPNVIGEAMACGVPCVVTDVGDSAMIVGKTGVVVPANDPLLICKGWKTIINLSRYKRASLGVYGRNRIVERFDCRELVERTETLLNSIGH